MSFSYDDGGVLAVDNLSLNFVGGESVAIVGPSGCGKSTLLALLAGFANPTAGEIVHTPAPAGRHPMTMVFQNETLLPWLNVVDNIKLFFRYNKGAESKSTIEARVRDLIALAGLGGFERFYPHQLSGGMRKRVAFLTSVAPLPRTLLLDEPFSSLDEPTRVGLHEDVLKIVRQYNMTMVLVTHDIAEAVTLADRVVILTKRPAQIADERVISVSKEEPVLEMRRDPVFLEVYADLWDSLARQIEPAGVRAPSPEVAK